MSLAKKHLDKLPEDWQAQFLDMYDRGCSDWELMREFGIKPKHWQIMYASLGESDFKEVVEFGNALCRAWWEQEGRINLHTNKFNTRLYAIQMENRFGWARKTEVQAPESSVQSADEAALDKRIRELTGKEQVSGDVET